MREASIAVQAEPPAGRFSNAVEAIVRAIDAGGVSDTVSTALLELTGLEAAALYVPGRERDRWERESLAGDTELLPPSVRIDHGPVARLLAAGRIAAGTDGILDEPADGGFGATPGTLWSIPLRDASERPLGVCLLAATEPRSLDPELEYRMFRLRPVIEGALVAVQARREQESALSILPELVDVAHALDEPIAQQLGELARIVARATRADAALVRVRDAAARYVETRAAWSRNAEGTGEVVGLRSSLHDNLPAAELGEVEVDLLVPEEVADWSSAGNRTLESLNARRVAIFPIESAYNRQASLWLVRAADRPFGEIDRAVSRIVTSHLQHTIDRHVGRLQTARATTAAQSAIRLLGRALVAGIKPEQTLRFIPRLYHEMFGAAGARLWRRTPDGGLSRIAGSGAMTGTTASPVVLQALEHPLELALSTDSRPHVAAVGLEYDGSPPLVVEFELRVERTLGRQEQTLAVDVAERVSQSLESAERAAVSRRQLERVGRLQEVLALASESFTGASIHQTVLEGMRNALGASAAGMVVVDTGAPRVWVSEGVPTSFADALARERQVLPGVAGSGQDLPAVISNIATDERLGELVPALVSAGWSSAAAVTIPLTTGDHTVGGILLIFEDGSTGLADGDQPLLEITGRHLGRAILNAREARRLKEETQRTRDRLERERESNRQVRALYEVSRTFATSMSLHDTTDAVVQAMADRLDVDAVWMTMPGETGALRVQAFHSVHEELGNAVERIVTAGEPREDPMSAHVLQHRQAVLVTPDSDDDDRYGGSMLLTRLAPFLERGSTVAVVPVATPNEVLGTVTLIAIDAGNALTQEKVDIATGVASQAALALDNARLYQQQKHFAEVIQESLLPTRLPRVEGIELGVLYRSASGGGAEVGGDFYDFLELEDGRLAVVLGDVCGKGVSAAADTAMTKYTFRALAREHPSPASFLAYANDVIAEEIALGKFVTLFYAVVDPVAQTVTCGNAGHPEPKILTRTGDGELELQSLSLEGLALGIMPDQDYEEQTLPFEPGSSLVVYTDGVVEARRGGRLYGQYRLERRLLEERDASAPQLAFAVYQDCAAYAEGGLGDDVAIVVVQYVDDAATPPETS